MGDELSLSATGSWIDSAAGTVRHDRIARASSDPGRRGREGAVEGRDAPEVSSIIVAAFGGVLLTCSALRARYDRRIRSLEDEIVRLSAVADRDHLTGLGNRRSFEHRLAGEWRRALRHGSHLSLALVDVDHFKAFNDTYGHPAGDDALRRVGGCLAGTLGRAADCAFRVGGEEFALILPDTDRNGAVFMGQRVRDALRNAALAHGGSPTGAVTVSFGSCSTLVRAGDEDAMASLSLADEALYEAKRAGRDRSVCVRRRFPHTFRAASEPAEGRGGAIGGP